MAEFTRKELLALTQDGLIQLANAGLVKRAMREIEGGKGPVIAEEADGCVVATYGDGTVSRLPRGKGPGDAHCTCPAGGICRHRVGLVLAYQLAASKAAEADGDVAAEQPTFWDPADISDAALDAMLVTSTRNELQAMQRQALEIRVTPGVVPTANLPMATVRFLVPHDLAYARCDCAAGERCVHVALAVQAFRRAREQGIQTVMLGGRASVADTAGRLRVALLALITRLIEEGVVGGMAPCAASLELVRRASEEAGATWLILALEALAQQIEAYAARSARYAEREVLALVAELYARTHVQDDVQAGALGMGEALETAMGSARLISLGGRVYAEGHGLRACVLLADTDTGTTMVLEKVFQPVDQSKHLDPRKAAGLRFAPGILVGALAHGQLLTAVARRRADGLLTLGAGRGGKTALVPHAGRYQLREPLLVRTLDALVEQARASAPALIRPRHRVREVHLFNVEETAEQAFSAGEQGWLGAVELADDGGTLYLERGHDGGAPDALENLFAAFSGSYGEIRQIAGPTRIEQGKVICEPWVICADSVLVPDLDVLKEAVPAPLTNVRQKAADVLEDCRAWLAEALHQGRRNLARDHTERGQKLVGQLMEAGYIDSARRLEGLLVPVAGSGRAGNFGALSVWLTCLIDE